MKKNIFQITEAIHSRLQKRVELQTLAEDFIETDKNTYISENKVAPDQCGQNISGTMFACTALYTCAKTHVCRNMTASGDEFACGYGGVKEYKYDCVTSVDVSAKMLENVKKKFLSPLMRNLTLEPLRNWSSNSTIQRKVKRHFKIRIGKTTETV